MTQRHSRPFGDANIPPENLKLLLLAAQAGPSFGGARLKDLEIAKRLLNAKEVTWQTVQEMVDGNLTDQRFKKIMKIHDAFEKKLNR